MTPEGRVKAKVKKAFKALHGCSHNGHMYYVWQFMPVQMGMGIPALDFIFCVNGHFVSIETKVKGKKLTPRQLQTKADMEAADGLVFVVDDDASLQVAMKTIIEECA